MQNKKTKQMQNKKTKQKQKQKQTQKQKQNKKTKQKQKQKQKQNKTKSRNFRKATGKQVNKQLEKFLKTQGTLSHKLDGKTIELKIDDDIISKINDILKQELQQQIDNKKKISESLKASKKAMKELLELFDEEHFQDLLKEIEALENMPLENFDKKNLKERENDAKIIKDEVKLQLEMGIENEHMAQSEIDNYQSTILADLEEMLTSVENSP